MSRWLFQEHEFLLRRPTFSYLAELERTQYLSRQEIEAIQLHRLSKLLKTACAHSPWHAERIRAAGIDLENLTWDGFRRLPTMTREDARRHGDEMVWRKAPGGAYRYTTGEPLIFYFGRKRQAAGEPIYPHQREIIAKVFGAPVAGEYGARDAGLIALESPAGQLLVNSEWVIVELLDTEGNPVENGHLGEVVVTNLASEAQPFIRYRTGDRARASSEPCRQGRGLKVLEEVTGRSTDFIVRPDGTTMHALALIYVLREEPGVRQFKIIQPDLAHLVVQLVPEAGLWRTESDQSIRKKLAQRIGQEVTVTIEITDHIPPEKSGKYRYVVSHVPLE